MSEKNKKIQKRFPLSTWSIENSMTVIVMMAIIVGWGLYSYQTMPRENFPEIVDDKIYISTIFPGNSAEDVEKLITTPIEDKIKNAKGIMSTSSSSQNDYSIIIIRFEGVDMNKAKQEIKEKVDEVTAESDWPKLDSGPKVEPNVFDMNIAEAVPIVNINLTGNYPIQKIKDYAEILERRIEDLPEIKEVDIRGAEEKEVEVAVDVFKMNGAQVSFQDVIGAISAENTTITGGNVPINGKDTNIRVMGEVREPQELENLVIKRRDGAVYLRDIAEINFKEKEPSTYAREYGKPVVMLDVKKRSGKNMIQAVEKIEKIVEEVKETKFPPDLKVTMANDMSVKTEMQVIDLMNNIIFGIILVVGVLMFFLGFRNASFVGIAIPVSMFLSLVVVSVLGYTLNTMVLFALVMGLGMLVDNAIVVVENVYTLVDEGMSPKEATKQGLGEVAWPIISSTATTLAAFFPLGLWPGTMGEFMVYFPITLSIVLTSSLVVALVITPVVASKFMKVGEENLKHYDLKKYSIIFGVLGVLLLILGYAFKSGLLRGLGNISLMITLWLWLYKYILYPLTQKFQYKYLPKLENTYKNFLTNVLRWPRPIYLIIGMIALFIMTFALFGAFTPKVLFFPENEPNQIVVYIEYPEGTDIEKTNATTKKVEQRVASVLDKYNVTEDGETYNYMVESVVSQVGSGAGNPNESAGSAAATPQKGKITATLREFKLRRGVKSGDVLDEVRVAVAGVPGAKISVEKDKVGPPAGYPISIEVSGSDYDELMKEAEQIVSYIESSDIQGIEGLKLDVNADYPELVIKVDRSQAGELGVTNQMVGATLRQSIYGWEASRYKPKGDNDDYQINVRLKEDQRENLSVLKNQSVVFTNPNTGQIMTVPIASVSADSLRKTYTTIKHEDYKRVVTIYSNVLSGYNPTEIVGKIQAQLQNYDFPDEVEYKFAGEQEEQGKNQSFLLVALLIGVVGIILIIVLQFNSISRPLIIMFTVLLSFIGVFIGMLLSQSDFVVMMTMMGIISLAGIVVNNAIVLVDYTDFLINSRKEELGVSKENYLPIKEIRHLIIKGGVSRLRPVLLTAITTVLGLIPLAIGLNINFFSLFSDYDPDIYVGGDNVVFWGPLAWTVINGLTFATFLTLIIVPVLYYLVYLIKIRWRDSKKSKESTLTSVGTE